jgi:F-type H+-transporting ATPase subunit delta
VSASSDATTHAATYAEALAAVAPGKDDATDVGERLAALASAWRRDRTISAFFLSGAVARDAKRGAIERLRPTVGPLLSNFLRVLLRRNRLSLLPDVADAFERILDRRLGRVRVVLETATPPSDSDVASWRRRLAEAVRREPVLTHRVRPALIGGAVLRVGDVIADGSVRRRLADLRDRALRASRERSSV